MLRPLCSLFSLGVVLSPAGAATLFDFGTTNDASFEHDSNGTNSPAPIPAAGSQVLNTGTFEWGSLATDTTPNTAVFSGGTFAANDWGGIGTFTSIAIDVSGIDAVNLSAQFDGFYNLASEFSGFFYDIGGGPITFGAGVEGVTYSDQPVGITGLDVSAASELVVGFRYSHNGSSEFFGVDSLTVSEIPESSGLLVGVIGLLGLIRRRR
jgi:hypothetical protein